MQLILITPEQTVPHETALVNQLFDLGLQRLHLRKKDYAITAYHHYLDDIHQQYHARIAVHEQFGLVKAFPSLGLHCKNYLLHDQTQMDAIIDLSPASLSASVHSWREIEENRYPFDYVFISPVFDSISKKGYAAAIDMAGMQLLKQNAAIDARKIPAVIALGGVDHTNIPTLHAHGFDGAAVLGAVWEAADPLTAFQKLQDVSR